MSTRRRYLNFTTPLGVDLAAVAKTGLSGLLIHETGYISHLTDWNYDGVDSPFWRLYHNPKAGCSIRHKGTRIPLQPDGIVLIPANTIFDCCESKPAKHFWIHFTVTTHLRVGLDAPLLIKKDELLAMMLVSLIDAHADSRDELRDQRLYHLSAALLHGVFSRLEKRLGHRMPEPLAELLDLIHSSPHSDLSNAYLAARVGMGLEKFIRWFREHVSSTPAAYVAESRVRMAREALALTEKSIEQIAAEFGFPNRHYFSRVFARLVGCGPAEFRNRQQKRRGL